MSYFSRAVHEPYECPVGPAIVSDLAKFIPYLLPVRWSAFPPQDHIANIDAAIAIRDRLEEVCTQARVYSNHMNGGLGIVTDGLVRILRRAVFPNPADPMIHRQTCSIPNDTYFCSITFFLYLNYENKV